MMKITRRCPMCDNVTSMEIDEWAIENDRTDTMGAAEYKFYKHGYCEVCSKSIYRAKKEESYE